MKPGSVKLIRPALFFTLMALTAILIGCGYVTGEAIKAPASPPEIANVSPVQANDLIQANQGITRFVILDVRTPVEYAEGHLQNAINLDFNSPSFKSEAGHLDKNFIYLVYCRTGARSAAASKILAELGFSHIYNMTGGMIAWQAAGLPVVK